MGKTEVYLQTLRFLPVSDWEAYLRRESGLPGPRGNLELAQAVAEAGELSLFLEYLSYTPERAPVNDPGEFLAFCGVVGLGRLIAEGQEELLERLRPFISDPRWRLREGVAMALQRVGKADMERLLSIAGDWIQGNRLEQRAAVAALAEPALLKEPNIVGIVLDLMDQVTASIERSAQRQQPDFKVLRQGLGYAWSVVVAALPDEGRMRMERWLVNDDPDVRWVMKENLKKKRLLRMDAEWAAAWIKRLE
jgi:hypothetical protein